MTLRALSIWGALVTLLCGGVSGAISVTRVYERSAVVQYTDNDLKNVFLGLDNSAPMNTIITKQVSLPIGAFNVGIDLSIMDTSELKSFAKSNVISTPFLEQYNAANDQYKITLNNYGPSNIASISSVDSVALGQCFVNANSGWYGNYTHPAGVQTFSVRKLNGTTWEGKSAGQYEMTFTGNADQVGGQFFGRMRAECVPPQTFNQYAIAHNWTDSQYAAAARDLLNAAINNKIPEHAILSPFTIGPSYTHDTSGAVCTVSTCGDTSAFEPGSGGGTGGTGGTGTTPACTKGDGTTSGNPYDCAPSDSTANCSIIDIPCNLRKAFIPSSNPFAPITDILKTKIPFSIFAKMFAPTETCALNIPITYMTVAANIPLDFCAINTRNSPLFTNMIKLFGSIMAVLALGKIGRFL